MYDNYIVLGFMLKMVDKILISLKIVKDKIRKRLYEYESK